MEITLTSRSKSVSSLNCSPPRVCLLLDLVDAAVALFDAAVVIESGVLDPSGWNYWGVTLFVNLGYIFASP